MKKIILSLMVCFLLVGCGGKLSVDDIKKELEVRTDKRSYTVNEATYATNEITINQNKMIVDGKKVTLGDYFFEDKKDNIQITGFYEQTGELFSIYRLVKDENGNTSILISIEDYVTSFEKLEWKESKVKNATDLILIDCTENMEEFGQTPLRYQVYALVNNKLVLVD